MSAGLEAAITSDARSGAIDAMARAACRLSATHFFVAIALGLANCLFLALTHVDIPVPGRALTIDIVALVGTIAAGVAADRARRRKTAWALLAPAYALLVLACLDQAWPPRELLISEIMAHCLVLAIAMADEAVGSGSSGRLAYISAALAGIAVGAFVWWLVLRWGPNFFTDDNWQPDASSRWFLHLHPIYTALHWLLFGGALALFHGERRLAQTTLERLRLAEIERIARSREVIESKLQAMQARVEPQFLFDTLAHVRALCARDSALAERTLEELVAFLRAAMPKIRGTASTLAQEAELVRAYVAIARVSLGGRLRLSIDVSDDAAAAKLPPMMLLPLVEYAVGHGAAPTFGNGELRLAGVVAGERLRLVIGCPGTAFVANSDAPTIASVRERLAALYGTTGRLSLGAVEAGATQALLDIPYERTP